MNLATEIPTDDCALRVNCGRDGTWVHFSASNGQTASLNIENMDRGGIIGSALRSWCEDRQKQAEQWPLKSAEDQQHERRFVARDLSAYEALRNG